MKMTDMFGNSLWWLVWLPGAVVLLVLLAMSYGWIAFSLQVRRLARTPCLRCGKPIGRAAVKEASRRCADEFRTRLQEHSGSRFRYIAIWHLCCPHCGYRMAYTPSEDSLVGEDTAPEANAERASTEFNPTAGPGPDD